MFGLTIKQLAYALLFGTLSLLVFFKTNHHIAIRVFAVCIFAVLAGLFIFLDFASFLNNLRRWLKFRGAVKGSSKLEKFIAVQKVEEDVIHV